MPPAAWLETRAWQSAGLTMFHFLWIGALAWPVLGLLRRVMRRTTPQVRYGVALGLLLAVAALPGSIFVATWGAMNETGRTFDHTTSSMGGPVAGETASNPFEPFARTTPAADSQRSLHDAGEPTSAQLPVGWTTALKPAVERACHVSGRWFPCFWIVGTPFTLTVLVCGLAGTRRIRRSSQTIAVGTVAAAGERLEAALCVGRHVAIAVCDRIAAPVLVGIVRPVILLPAAILAGCSAEQIEMILIHELAHVRRCDNLVNLAQRVIEAVLFFQPAVWWLSSWARLEREECCDRIVVAHTGRPQAYAETLAALALPGMMPSAAAVALADRHLVTRIRHILNLEDETMSVSRKSGMALAGLLISCGWIVSSFAQQTTGASAPTAVAAPANKTNGADPAVVLAEIAAGESVSDGQIVPEISRQSLGVYLRDPCPAATLALECAAEPVRVNVVYQLLGASQSTSLVRPWGPEQATGAPDSLDPQKIEGTAWCPATADGQEEWLELTYAEPVEPVMLLVYECSKPGAVVSVAAFDAEGNELNAWSGKDPAAESGAASAVAAIPLKVKKIKIVRVRLYLDSPHVEGWNEIDAVGILDGKGVVHWASAATASSFWVNEKPLSSAILQAQPLPENWEGRVTLQALRALTSTYSTVDPVAAGMGGIVPAHKASAEIEKLLRSQFTVEPSAAVRVGASKLSPTDDQERARNESIAQFEERIKKLEAELAGLREALQKLK